MQVAERLVGERVEPASSNVFHQLAIPCRRIELGEPRPERSQIFARQTEDCFLNFLPESS